MEGTFIKHSSVLGRDAVWHKQQRIASLPKYLCFQFMRFFWKATPDNRDHVGVKCKIMRAVTYPEVSTAFYIVVLWNVDAAIFDWILTGFVFCFTVPYNVMSCNVMPCRVMHHMALNCFK